jgi:Zn-dependent alcohol dehydrogenase
MVTRTAPLDAWDDALHAMQDGDVIRTVLVP